MITALLLILFHRLCCLKYCQIHTFYYCQLQNQNPVIYYLLITFLWYLILVVIHEKYCESSFFWVIRAYKLVYLLGITLKKDQKSWLLACNSAEFWGICYSARLYYLEYSFEAKYLYCGLVLKAFRRIRGSAGKQSSILGVWRIVFLLFLT